MLPTDTWKTADEFAQAEDPSASFWPAIPFQAIERLVTNLRSPPTPCKANREKYAAGVCSVVIEVVFEDDEVWVVRLRTEHVRPLPPPLVLARTMDSDIATMKLLRQRTTIPVPAVFAHSSTKDNELGLPYTVMSAVVGRPPDDYGISTNRPIPAEKQAFFMRFCSSLADIHLQLNRIRFNRIGSIFETDGEYSVGPLTEGGTGPFNTASDFYEARFREVESEMFQVDEHSEERDNSALCLWLYRLAIANASQSLGVDDRGPFMLTHTDLHINNTLVDESGAIVAVLDWEDAACLPVELFAGQMIDFVGSFSAPPVEHWISRFQTYNACLRAAELAQPPEAPRSPALTDWHSSTTARLLAFVDYYMHAGDYGSEMWLEILCEHVMGTTDWRTIQASPAFQEWYRAKVGRGQ